MKKYDDKCTVIATAVWRDWRNKLKCPQILENKFVKDTDTETKPIKLSLFSWHLASDSIINILWLLINEIGVLKLNGLSGDFLFSFDNVKLLLSLTITESKLQYSFLFIFLFCQNKELFMITMTFLIREYINMTQSDSDAM